MSNGKDRILGDEEGQKIFALLKMLISYDLVHTLYTTSYSNKVKTSTVFPLKVHGGMTINDLKQALINDGNLKLDDLSDDTLRIIFRKLLNGIYALCRVIVAGSIVIFQKRVKILKS